MFAWIIFAALVALARASGDFVVLHTPDSISFKGSKQIDQSLLKEVFSASLGFTVKQRTEWNGLAISKPFSYPEAVLALAIEGIDSLEMVKGKRYPLNVDEVEETTWQALSGRLGERENDNTLVRIYLGDGLDALGQSALGELKPISIDESSLKALSLNNDKDRKFLEEIQLLRAIAKKVPTAISADGKPDVYWLVVSGLRPVYNVHHGKNSPAAKEALALLNEALHDVSKAFMDVYKDQVLIAAFTNDASPNHRKRSIAQSRRRRDVAANVTETTTSKVETSTSKVQEEESEEKEKETRKVENNNNEHEKNDEDESEDEVVENSSKIDDNTNIDTLPTNKSLIINDTKHEKINDIKRVVEPKELNLAESYSEDYPVIFNICLWFGVVFFFSLLAICIYIGDMDPGRDSIIYRMTSTRMKKDN